MSTSSQIPATDGVLPTFTSIRDRPIDGHSYGESSNASSSRSHKGNSVEEPISHANGRHPSRRSPATSTPANSVHNHERENLQSATPNGTANGTVRREKRSSGGFLLGSSTKRFSSTNYLAPSSVKGKEKLHAYKRTSNTSNGVATVDTTATSPSLSQSSPASASHGGRSSRSDAGRSSFQSSLRDKNSRSDELPQSTRGSTSKGETGFIGFDTDPVQIVDMALRLNEARARQAALTRNVSSSTKQRHVSGPVSIKIPSTPSRHLTTDSSALKRASAAPTSVRGKPSTPNLDVISTRSPPQDSPTPGTSIPGDDQDMYLSRATQNRVAKAKEFFELAYEHRRLLSHLPPLHRPPLPNDRHSHLEQTSRAYNPLQYVRNRKLRFRERTPIDVENDGWHDVAQVRSWVDSVVTSHKETQHNPLECVRLPRLKVSDDDGDDRASKAHVQPGVPDPEPTAARPRRPKSDWVTHPADLLADAFWTEQGLNKKKIYNRDNELIFAPDTKFVFSGYRNVTPVDVPEELKRIASQETQSDDSVSLRSGVAAAPTLPTFEPANKDDGWARAKFKFSRAVKKGSKSTKKFADDIFDTSSDSSESDRSSDSDNNLFTGKGKNSRGREWSKKVAPTAIPLSDGDPFAPPIESKVPRTTDNENLTNQHKRRFFGSVKIDRDELNRSSFDDDSTAPNTPMVAGFPSIAINLSPPGSRSVSPSKREKHSILDSVKSKVHSHRDHIDTVDFAKVTDSTHSTRRNSRVGAKRVSIDHSQNGSPTSRGTSPFTRAKASVSDPSQSAGDPEPHERVSNKTSSHRKADSQQLKPQRVRGIFKGGRIAEIVGHEVNRVGDYILKRDPPRNKDTDSGSISGYESDSDELSEHETHHPNDYIKKQELSPSGKIDLRSKGAQSSPKTESNGSPSYHIQGLPSFTSPFQQDRDAQQRRLVSQSPGGTPQPDQGTLDKEDPISAAVAARRMAGKSPRLTMLAPPMLDTKAATPDGRRSSYGFGLALDINRARSASQLYNGFIENTPAQMTSTSGTTQNGLVDTAMHHWPTEEQGTHQSSAITTVTMSHRALLSEVMRMRALLSATTIKAISVADFCNQAPKRQSAFLLTAFQSTGASPQTIGSHLPVRRRDEHRIATHHLADYLTQQGHEMNQKLSSFAQNDTQLLHREIQVLEDKIDSTLFPQLQKLSDQAGQLAQNLTTTSTLAVKSVNDEVNEAYNLKRKGVRFGRALGYKLIECAVVTILWLIWFTVTSIRFSLGFVRAIWNIIAWLFFLK